MLVGSEIVKFLSLKRRKRRAFKYKRLAVYR